MKRIILTLCVFLSTALLHETADAQSDITYKLAEESDVAGITEMLDEAFAIDFDKVSLHPNRTCRKKAVEEMIKERHLFIATIDNQVIASKKLYITEWADKKDILENLIRSEGPKATEPSFKGTINNDGTITDYTTNTTFKIPDMGVCIYNGLEYTKKEFRGLKLNKKLTEFAYNHLAGAILEKLEKSPIKNITLMYGLSLSNAGADPITDVGRTRNSAETFRNFIKKYVTKTATEPVSITLSRYNGFFPTFDRKNDACDSKLLPDEQSAPIYSYVLTYDKNVPLTQ